MPHRSFAAAALSLALAASLFSFADPPPDDWPAYGRDPGGQRFSPLDQINRKNVASLRIAWTYRTGDAYQPPRGRATAFEATPLYVDGILYLATPLGRIIALDPVTGTARWSYDAKIPRDAGYGDFANRGVSTWKPERGPRRIFLASIDARLIAVDAATGKPVRDFGDNGVVNLRTGLRTAPRGFADYEETSPPAVAGNTLVVGSAIADNGSVNQPSGEVRGFDTVTGKLKWTWHPVPDPKGPGAANAWSIIVVDEQRNMVFVPTSSPSPDYYGGERTSQNFGNSVVALRADTGERIWHFQTVHHDLWDYDVASPPILFDVRRNGSIIAAVGAGSKSGNFFVLDRVTGKPIFGVEERPVPKSDVEGEAASPTQPFPLAPPPLAPQKPVAPWGNTEADLNFCRAEIAKLRNEGVFTPPSIRGSLLAPGNVGGMAWGGAAYDPQNRLLIIPTNNLAAQVRLIPRADFERERESAGRDLTGGWEFAPQRGTPYGMARRLLRAPSGLPCTPPPWGVLNGVDADTGAVKWTVPTGKLPFGDPPDGAGSLSFGGPIATAGGLVFMAGTLDPAIYAYDVETGKQLWKGDLPTSARATPMTYRAKDGKQYLVIAAGGHGLPGTKPGDYLVAFSLK